MRRSTPNGSTVAPSPPLDRAPSCGLTGWTLAVEYLFGTAGNVRDVTELRNLFTSDAPWGRINGELQTFQPFNPRNHVFVRIIWPWWRSLMAADCTRNMDTLRAVPS